MSKRKLLSICIPSYNRPEELLRLLQSIDAGDPDKIEIVIREDRAPRRSEVRKTVEGYRAKSVYEVRYIENDENFGYDKNIRNAAKSARGKWVLFMGDDDIFIKGALDRYLAFLEKHPGLGYVLRRYRKRYRNGEEEEFRYFAGDKFFKAGDGAAIELFRRSLFISGVTYRRDCFEEYDCTKLDGTLLFQLYIQACVCHKYPSAYCDVAITECLEGGIPYFGKSDAEKDLYEAGKNTFRNSINFLKQVRVVTEYFDRVHSSSITPGVLRSYAKYSYGYLYEHRDDGREVFREYAKEIRRIGLGSSFYFYIYYWGLYLFGTRNCNNIIRRMKRMLGRTPRL